MSRKKYHPIAQLLHWLMAGILIYLILFSGFEHMPDELVVDKIQLHAVLGVSILILGAIRLAWRFKSPPPEDIEAADAWQILWARRVHLAFYGLFFMIPVLGLILAGLVDYTVSVYDIFELSSWLNDNPKLASWFNSLHGFGTDVLTGLLLLHVAAAFYKQFYQGKTSFKRMLP